MTRALAVLFALGAVAAPAELRKAHDRIQGTVDPGPGLEHRVTLAASDFFYAHTNGIGTTVEILDPNGVSAVEPRRGAALIVNHPGEYILRLRTSAPASQRYTLTALEWRKSTPIDESRLRAVTELNEGARKWELATAESRQESLAHYRRARAIYQEIGDPYFEARCAYSEGLVASNLGLIDDAIRTMNEGIALYQKAGDRSGEAGLRNLVALLHANRSEYSKAFDHYDAALAIRRQAKDATGEAEIERNIAIAHSAAGHYQKALDIYESALARFRAAKDRYQEAVTLVQLSDFYLRTGDFDRAIEYAQQSLPLHRANTDKTAEVHTLTNLGEACAAQDRHADALKHLNAAMALARESGLAWLHTNTQAYAAASEEALGRLSRARELYLEALHPMRAHGNRDGSSRLLTRLGLLALRQGRADDAGRDLAEALDLSRDLENPIAESMAQSALAQLALHRKDRALARKHSERALEIVENVRTRVDGKDLRARFLAVRGSWFETHVAMLMDERDVESALHTVERSRARSLLDLLLESEDTADSAASPPPEPRIARSLIPPDTAILEYYVTPARSWLFAVTRERVTAHELPGASVIAADVRRLREVLAQPGRTTLGAYTREASRLYRTYVAPAVAGIAAKKKLVISADRALLYLPFEALLTAAPQPSAFNSLPYLVRKWTVSYSPSASAYLALLHRAPVAEPPKLDLVAFGNPRGDLPGAGREVRSIARAFDAGRVAIFEGARATKAAATGSPELAAARIVHFATHGVVREGRAALSGLLLAGRDVLDTSDVLRLRWNADLVVLSGCETGLGTRLAGEGILGLTRAFLFAGASNVAVSLWPVADDSTELLMRGFYEKQSAESSASEALRAAKLELIRSGRFAHPYYWAPFVLSGKS